MTIQLPFASREVRWFFEGPLSDHSALEEWFRKCEPFGKLPGVNAPAWQPRLDDAPDVYLLLPGHEDMGIKWREGLLQVKGLVASLGEQVFCGRHSGIVERWIKWSYGDLPAACADLFGSPGIETAAIHKIRLVRLVDLELQEPVEVDSGTNLAVGMAVELTRIVARNHEHCSLGFETFPDQRVTDAVFHGTVEAFLASLDAVRLDVNRSLSYSAWLDRL